MHVPVRPTPAIETIADFCAAELLANAAKYSQAKKITIFITERAGLLALQVTDDGLGGADPTRGSGLSGLAQRVAVVDGRLDVASPPGGPTKITVELPLRAGNRCAIAIAEDAALFRASLVRLLEDEGHRSAPRWVTARPLAALASQ